MKNTLSKRDISILIGNCLEHYDTSLYGFLAPILAPIFFPKFDPVVQIILAYSLLATSLFTRPIGVFIFGNIALKRGAVQGLSYSLIGVAITTVMIGFIPSYDIIGCFAPICLILIRMLRGIFASGESTIAKLYIMEGKSPQAAYKASYFYQTSTMIGIVLASFFSWIVFILEFKELWRVCFWLGGITGFFGYYFRKFDQEKGGKSANSPFISYKQSSIKLILENKINILRVAITTSFSHLTYTFPFIFMNSFIPLVTSISVATMMKLNTVLLIIDMLLIPYLGKLSQNYSPRNVMIFSGTILSLTILPIWSLIPNSSLYYVTFVRFWIVILGVLFLCPLNLWYKSLFNPTHQYFLVGIGNTLGATTFGRLTPAICMSLWYFTGSSFSIALYFLIITLLTLLAIKST